MLENVKMVSKSVLNAVGICTALICLIGTPVMDASALTGREIDTSVDVSYDRFVKQVPGGAEFAQSAKGLLILPNVTKAGFVIGGEYGEGALRVDGITVGYYNIIAGSFGLQIGVQSKDIIIAFMDEGVLKRFRAGNGWEAGVDGNIAFISVGGGRRLDTTTIKDPIVAFVFDVKGLMADLSLKGAKFTKIPK